MQEKKWQTLHFLIRNHSLHPQDKEICEIFEPQKIPNIKYLRFTNIQISTYVMYVRTVLHT